jgi:hypothetical protein
MEVDGESTVVAPSSSSPLSLPIFAVIRAAQAAHGLRYSDYARYRCVIETNRVEWKKRGLLKKRETINQSIKKTAAIKLSLNLSLDPNLDSSLRSFCSKKLRRLSCSLKLNAQTQRGKFVKRKIEPEATTEVG